jgi:hypothetical protein
MTELTPPPAPLAPLDAKSAKAEAMAAKARAKALRPWYKKKRFIFLGLIVLLIIILVATTSGSKTPSAKATTATTVAPSTPAKAKTVAPTTPPPTAAPAAPVVLWQQSGSGQASGQQFTVPASVKGWNEVWTYNCSAFGSSGNFITTITGFGGAANTTDSGANELGTGGSGTNHYYDTGTFTIGVNSECSWTDEAVTVPK